MSALNILGISSFAVLLLFAFAIIDSKQAIIDRLQARLDAQDEVVLKHAKSYHGTLLATLGIDGVWRFINKKGVPCRVFREVE